MTCDVYVRDDCTTTTTGVRVDVGRPVDVTTTTTSVVPRAEVGLPFTGADVGPLAAVGLGLVVVGSVLVRRARSRA